MRLILVINFRMIGRSLMTELLRRHCLVSGAWWTAGLATLCLCSAPASAQENNAASAPVLTLPTVDIQGARPTPRDPTPGFVATESTAGTKTDAPLLETPQAISTITRDRIEAQAPVDSAAALRYSAGVLPEPFGNDIRYGWPRVRGFNLQNSQFLDGLRLPSGTYATPQVELWGLERMEILRGPSSVLYGQIPPGGLLSYTSHRPSAVSSGEVNVQAGSYDCKQAAFDVTGPVPGTDGTWLYRLTGLARDADTQVKEVGDNRRLRSTHRDADFARRMVTSDRDAPLLMVLGDRLRAAGAALRRSYGVMWAQLGR
jgi:iron complex outermembrane receptor protein